MQKKDVRAMLICVLLYIPFGNLIPSRIHMSKFNVSFLSLLILSNSYAMRCPIRARPCQRPTSGPALRANAPLLSANLPHRNFSTAHEDHTQTKRQETWARIKNCATERARELRAMGAKHRDAELKLRAQMAQHIRFLRIYETLAQLEVEKFRLFELTINRLNESAHYCEEPNLDTEAKLLQLLHETYEEFYNALPEEDKLHLEDKF
jgi:hypothetical protein